MVSGLPLLLAPIRFREIEFRNRIVVSPMSTYSAIDGLADDFHRVHLGRFALGGAGLVMVEATAVTAQGRGTPGCLGIWSDAHVAPLQGIARLVRSLGAVPGLQLGHSGPKGSSQRPWHGGAPLGPADQAVRRETPWPTVSASPAPFAPGWPAPHALTATELDGLVADYAQAAERAARADFDLLELHCAHGYLLHAFLSPLANQRDDDFGGSLENRMRFPLRVFEAIRATFPAGRVVQVRISAVDGRSIGWSLADSMEFARQLRQRGADLVVCSSGGFRVPKDQVVDSRVAGFQVPFAQAVRQGAGVPTAAVGLITRPEQAEAILRAGHADVVALGREMLVNPNWANHAALSLTQDAGWSQWPEPFGWWLKRRTPT